MNLRIPFALALAILPITGFSQWSPPQPQISVSGSAELKVAPDEITISAGVQTRDAALPAATRQNDERMATVLAFLKSSGIPEKHIKTDFIRVEPDYANDSLIEPRYYTVRKSIEIKLSSVTNLEAVVTGLLKNGANYIHDVDFRTSELRKYRDEARAKATRAAREKAEAMARELGVKCGKPISISANEWGGWWNWEQSGWRRGNFYGNYSQNVVQNIGSPDPGGETTSLGQISVSASVNVLFAIE